MVGMVGGKDWLSPLKYHPPTYEAAIYRESVEKVLRGDGASPKVRQCRQPYGHMAALGKGRTVLRLSFTPKMKQF